MSEIEAYIVNQLQDEYGMTRKEAGEAAARQAERLKESVKREPVAQIPQTILDLSVKGALERHLAVHRVSEGLTKDMVDNPELSGAVFRHPSTRTGLTPAAEQKPVLRVVRRIH